MTKRELTRIFNSFNDLRVLVIGDVMVDSYMWGNVSRISPEAPVPVVAINSKEKRLGGAANVALNVKAMGAQPILCSVIGVDKAGDVFMELLKEEKLSPKGILKSRDRITTQKTRIIAQQHQMMRVDEETEESISEVETEQLITRISFLLKHEKIDAIIFEDYDKGLITPRLIQRVIELARQKAIPTIVDPKKKNFLLYRNVTLFKPNLKELREGLKADFDPDNFKEFQRSVDHFRQKQKIGTALITLSEMGIYISSKMRKALIPALVRNVSDVSGAGDTVVCVAALSLALKLKPYEMAVLANLAGGQVCEKVGVVPVNKEQLLEEALELNWKKK